MALPECDGRINGFERDLELQEDEVAGLQNLRRAIDIGRGKIRVRAFDDEDRVLSRRLDHDRSDAARLARDPPDVARVDSEPFQILDRGVGEHVVPHGGDHDDGGAQFGGGDGLVGSLAAVAHFKARRFDRLPSDRHAVHISNEIDHIAADDRDARVRRLNHPELPSTVAAAAARPFLVATGRGAPPPRPTSEEPALLSHASSKLTITSASTPFVR